MRKEEDLLTPNPKLASPIQVDEHLIDVLQTVFFNANKSPNLSPFLLGSVSCCPEPAARLLRDFTVGLVGTS